MKCLMTVLAASLAFAAFAQEPDGAAKGGRRGAPPSLEPIVQMVRNPKMVEKIGFTEEQVAKLKAIGDSRAELKELQAKVRQGSQRQAELLKAEKIDEAAVMAAVDEVWDAKKEIAKIQTKRVIAVRTVLSPEQVRQALETFREMRGRRGAKGEKGAKAKKPAKVES